MQIINTYQAKTQLSKLIEAAIQGEEIIISKAGKPLVRLVPYEVAKNPRIPGKWRGKVTISDDFDELPQDVLKSFYGDDAK